MLIQKNGAPITCIDDWKRLAPPKSDDQWVEGRSAFELANAWCGTGTPVLPKELQSLLESRKETQGLSVVEVIPAHKSPSTLTAASLGMLTWSWSATLRVPR